MWTSREKKFFKTLNSPHKIQNYVDGLVYNPCEASLSPRYTMLSGDGHCLEGGLFAAAALEFLGHAPLMVNLAAYNDDHHVIAIYKTRTGWGSISKSNTTLLRGREPYYRSVRELVMSYFDFYFNVKGELSLYSYTDPINLNHFNHFNWRWSEENLVSLGLAFLDETHYELLSLRELKKLPKVKKQLMDACFLGADVNGLYQA